MVTVKRLLAVVALLAVFFAPSQARAEEPVCNVRWNGRGKAPLWHERTVRVKIDLGDIDTRVCVLLPTDYNDGTRRTYPVLYLLHGVGDTYRTWTDNTDVDDFMSNPAIGSENDLIIVMPDGGHTPEAGWYSDWVDGSRDWETYHTKVLVRWIDRSYRTKGKGHRAVAGNSIGGFGAMSYAARNEGLFEAAASFSGLVDTMYGWPANGFVYTHEEANKQLGTPQEGVWGDHVQNEKVWRDHNPTDRATDLADVKLFVASGTGTPGGPAGDINDPSKAGNYPLENFIFQQNVSFAKALKLAGVPFEMDFYGGGYHGWPYWQRELHWALPQILEVIG